MDLLRWGRSPWGEWVLTHVSWSLFWASLFAGVLFFVAHASYMLFSAHRKRSNIAAMAVEIIDHSNIGDVDDVYAIEAASVPGIKRVMRTHREPSNGAEAES